MPLLSIITVTYNAETTLIPTMESVGAQSCHDFEHIIVDGLSTDNTLSIASRYNYPGLTVISEKDQGIYDAMNKGLSLAKGRYIVFLNAGDSFADRNTVQKIAEAAKGNNFPDIIYGQTIIVDNDRKIIGKRHLSAPENLTKQSFANGMVVCHQAFITRRDIAPKYDLNYRFSADYDWCLKILGNARNNLYLGKDPVIHYLNEGVTTRNHRKSLWERYKIMSENFGYISTTFNHLGFLVRSILRKIKR